MCIQGVTSLLPRLAREYRRIEQIVLGEIDDRKDIGVSAKALDAIFEDFDEIEGAAVNLLGRKKTAQISDRFCTARLG